MSEDFSRDSFRPQKAFAGVFLQQGRPVLDADFNEMVRIMERRIRAATVDTIGRGVVPRETPDGFGITLTGGGLGIGRGRAYVDGMLAECRGDPEAGAVFDRAREEDQSPEGVLDEMIPPPEGDVLDFLDQPYWPTAALPDDLGAGRAAAYLVVWQRPVTPTEDPDLLEPALGGLDTTTRWQTVWQVRLLEDVGANVDCSTPVEDLEGWTALTAPSTARLSTGTVEVDTPEDPCLVPPTEGFTGIEEQFFRVELHAPDPDAAAPLAQQDWRFKYSRENASVRASVTSIAADALSVTVARIGRDAVLRFAPGDWVEITDDHREFEHRSGQMLRVEEVDADTRTVIFETAVAAEFLPGGGDDTVATRHTRLMRWDQHGVIRLADGANSLLTDLGAVGSDGLIPVPGDGTPVILESGVTVAFGTAEGPGGFREMDHWRFAARTATTSVELLEDAPPHGVQRHYCRLAIVRAAENLVNDCRVFWPPEFGGGEGEGCACTVCVTAEGHNSGALTIQQAIDEVPPEGGTVCLEAGTYLLREPVVIANRAGLALTGQGIGTVLTYEGAGGAVRVETGTDIRLERFSLMVRPAAQDANGGTLPGHGVTAQNTALLALRRLAVIVASGAPEDSINFGIALDGIQIGTVIEECVALAPNALGARSSYGQDNDGDLQFAGFAELRVRDCILFGGRTAVRIERAALNLSAALFSRNLLLGGGTAVRVNWAELPAAGLGFEASTIGANGAGLVLSAGTLRVQDCEISAGAGQSDGILLVPNLLPDAETDAQIVGNTIFDLGGAGIRLAGRLDTVLIKRNILRDCGAAGIAVSPDASVRHVAIDNNVIERIAQASPVPEAAGIVLASAESGQILGNSVRAVGLAGFQGQRYAGIAVIGCGSVEIGSNFIAEIGGEEPEQEAVGIMVLPPYVTMALRGNRILGPMAAGDGAPVAWRAIEIGRSGGDFDGRLPPVFTGATAAVPTLGASGLAYFVVGDEVIRASGSQFAMALPSLGAQIAVDGNQVRTRREHIGRIVQVVDGGAVSLVMGGNQVDYRSEAPLSELVRAAAPRIAFANNTLTHPSGDVSARLFTGTDAGGATVLGNITRARILLNNGGLPAPFGPLNILT
ncbi:DUF6519 domain-containing protein [Salipiger sp. H15]|uniref:DUF6519 domain-containing protein n=1 Tax=Alloyangia sp. H15 TaxID=3029062 RepID=A0AAU8ALJ0_9RHOB